MFLFWIKVILKNGALSMVIMCGKEYLCWPWLNLFVMRHTTLFQRINYIHVKATIKNLLSFKHMVLHNFGNSYWNTPLHSVESISNTSSALKIQIVLQLASACNDSGILTNDQNVIKTKNHCYWSEFVYYTIAWPDVLPIATVPRFFVLRS